MQHILSLVDRCSCRVTGRNGQEKKLKNTNCDVSEHASWYERDSRHADTTTSSFNIRVVVVVVFFPNFAAETRVASSRMPRSKHHSCIESHQAFMQCWETGRGQKSKPEALSRPGWQRASKVSQSVKSSAWSGANKVSGRRCAAASMQPVSRHHV